MLIYILSGREDVGGDGAVHGTSGPDFGRTDIYRPLIEIAPRKSKTPQKPLPGVYIYIRIRPPRPRNEVSEPSRVDHPKLLKIRPEVCDFEPETPSPRQ